MSVEEAGAVKGPPIRRALLAAVLIPLAFWVNRVNLGLVKPAQASTQEANPAYEKLISLMEAGKRDEARTLALELAGGEPGDPHLSAVLMDTLVGLGKAPEAVAFGWRALEADPTLHGLRLRQGRALARLGQREEAEAEFRKVVDALPRNYRARIEIGRLYHHEGKLHVAVENYRQALAIRENFAEGQMLLGSALADGLDLDGAIAAFRRTIELDGKNLDAMTNLGMVLLRKDEKKQAKEWFERVLEKSPGEKRATNGLRMLAAAEQDERGY